MRFPQHWARCFVTLQIEGRAARVPVWAWSELDAADAERKAQARAAALQARQPDGYTASWHYGRDAVHEEVLQRISHDGAEIAVITRNCYGAEILNAAHAMFVDVDVPKPDDAPQPSLMERLRKAPPAASNLQRALALISAFAQSNPALTLRVYRTAGGLRVLFTNRSFDPADAGTQTLLQALGADPLYVKLCLAQRCFRARLTPKPYRVGISDTAPVRRKIAPDDAPALGAERAEWIKTYAHASAGHAVCALVAEHGMQLPIAELRPILEHHDRRTRVREGLPLA